MKICVYGAGAVGGYFAARLAAAGHDVSVVVRGENLQAMVRDGLQMREGAEAVKVKVRASQNPAELGPQDLVISTLKATGLRALATGVQPLLGPRTPIVFAQNGIPWWYASGSAQGSGQPDLGFLDPGGVLRASVGIERVIGGVIHSSNRVVAPGVVENESPGSNRLIVGEVDDRPSERIAELRALLEAAGLKSPEPASIRTAIWNKLVFNLSGSPLCVLTGAPATVITEYADAGKVAWSNLHEAAAIARACGVEIAMEPLETSMRNPPNHKSSLLQDYELHRPMEVDAILMGPLELARAAGVPAPGLQTVAWLVSTLAQQRKLYTPH